MKITIKHFRVIGLLIIVWLASVVVCSADHGTSNVGILTVGDVREQALEGFHAKFQDLAEQRHLSFTISTLSAENDRKKLPELARELVSSTPDLIIAAGGVEADALLTATKDKPIPVVFLVVSSSVDRGLVESYKKPGGNLTGIDTNDTVLTEKRMWFVKKLFPQVRRIICFNVPGIKPSEESVRIAKQTAPNLGFDFIRLNVDDAEDIRKAATTFAWRPGDAILLNPCAPVSKAVKSILLPVSIENKVPVFGYSKGDVLNGAVASYGPSRVGIGRQGAHLAVKILSGSHAAPMLPVEFPDDLELVMNRKLASRLGLNVPDRAYKIADLILDPEL